MFHLVTILFLEIVGLGFTMPGVRGGMGGAKDNHQNLSRNTQGHSTLGHKAWLQHHGIAIINPFKVLPILMEENHK